MSWKTLFVSFTVKDDQGNIVSRTSWIAKDKELRLPFFFTQIRRTCHRPTARLISEDKFPSETFEIRRLAKGFDSILLICRMFGLLVALSRFSVVTSSLTLISNWKWSLEKEGWKEVSYQRKKIITLLFLFLSYGQKKQLTENLETEFDRPAFHLFRQSFTRWLIYWTFSKPASSLYTSEYIENRIF